MPIVFDEVVGSVDGAAHSPEPSMAPEDKSRMPTAKHQNDMPMLRAQMTELRERAERLRAD